MDNSQINKKSSCSFSSVFPSQHDYEILQAEIYQLKQLVNICSEDCLSVEDSLQKEYARERGVTN